MSPPPKWNTHTLYRLPCFPRLPRLATQRHGKVHDVLLVAQAQASGLEKRLPHVHCLLVCLPQLPQLICLPQQASSAVWWTLFFCHVAVEPQAQALRMKQCLQTAVHVARVAHVRQSRSFHAHLLPAFRLLPFHLPAHFPSLWQSIPNASPPNATQLLLEDHWLTQSLRLRKPQRVRAPIRQAFLLNLVFSSQPVELLQIHLHTLPNHCAAIHFLPVC